MSYRNDMSAKCEEKWLNIFRPVLSGCRVPDMPYPNLTNQGV